MNKLPLSGGCLCGKVRFEITSNPKTLYACHCTACQTATGSALFLGMIVLKEGLHMIQGDVKLFERNLEDGRISNLYRCPDCLNPLWGGSKTSNTINIWAGTLDDSSSLQPVGHIWTRSAQSWVQIPKDVINYEQQPPNMDEFIEAWKAVAM